VLRRERWDAETVELAVEGRRKSVGVSGAVLVRWCLDASFASFASLRDGGGGCDGSRCDSRSFSLSLSLVSLEALREWRRPKIGMLTAAVCWHWHRQHYGVTGFNTEEGM
jgi:hypothetical protein